jgi:ribonuclease T2
MALNVRGPRSPAKFSAVNLALALAVFWCASQFGAARAAPADSDCILDNCADKKPPPDDGGPEPSAAPDAAAPTRGSSGPGSFDFYVLALSWSSGFCKTPAAARARHQCDPGANLGFVVHGLWPQYEHGYPSDCGLGAMPPSRIALQAAAGLYPDEGLARYEWRKHGACSGKSPVDYFNDVRRARGAIVIPPPFQDARTDQTWKPLDIQRAFIAANRRLRPGMVGIACARGVLQEVRICFSKDLRDFRDCPEVSRRGCPIGRILAPSML